MTLKKEIQKFKVYRKDVSQKIEKKKKFLIYKINRIIKVVLEVIQILFFFLLGSSIIFLGIFIACDYCLATAQYYMLILVLSLFGLFVFVYSYGANEAGMTPEDMVRNYRRLYSEQQKLDRQKKRKNKHE